MIALPFRGSFRMGAPPCSAPPAEASLAGGTAPKIERAERNPKWHTGVNRRNARGELFAPLFETGIVEEWNAFGAREGAAIMKKINCWVVVAQGLFWTWFFCIRYTATLQFSFAECCIMLAMSLVVAFGMAVKSTRFAPYLSRRGFVCASAGLAAAGTLAKTIATSAIPGAEAAQAIAGLVSCLLLGASSSPLFICAMETLSGRDMGETGMSLSIAALITVCASALLCALEPLAFSLAATALPIAFAACARSVTGKTTVVTNSEGGSTPHEAEPSIDAAEHAQHTRLARPVRPVLMMAAVEFAACFSTFPFLSQTTSSIALALGAICVAAAFMLGTLVPYFANRFNIRVLYQVSLPLMAAGLLAAPLVPHQFEALACALTNIGYFGFLFLTIIVLNENCRKGNVPSAWAFGFLRCAMLPAQFVGAALVNASTSMGGEEPFVWALHSVALLAVVACSVAFLNNVNFIDSWKLTKDSPAESNEELPLITRCAMLARRYGLTHREEEVCLLMAKGKTVPQAAEELFISKETAKSHLKHVYTKLEIHSKEELLERIAQQQLSND